MMKGPWLEWRLGFFGRYFRGQRQETGGGGVVPAYSRKNRAPVEVMPESQ
jgi:hypothetical protein